MDIDWEIIYTEAEYVIPDLGITLKIGDLNTELEDWMISHGISQYAVITASNPMSILHAKEENVMWNKTLWDEICFFPHINGFGVDPKGAWEAEHCFLIGGISLSQASMLAHKYRQRAFIYGSRLEPPTLIWTGLSN
jgi:hypothetical protein